MNCIKPVLCLLGMLVPLLGAAPVLAGTAEQFSLGNQVADPASLPAKPVTASGGKAAGKSSVKATSKAGGAAPAKATAKGSAPARKVATKNKSRKSADVIATDIPPAKLDLTLPKDMVGQLQPPGKEGTQPQAPSAQAAPDGKADGKPILPSLFAPKEGAGEPFQLNGRLLTNEMDLQLRNDARRDVEGAALDFKFRQ